ncbi:hypothetical protein [Actinokineospora spheciospongiae]|uniref:hypothetical protein n=1 Tax=Actinokineospora spheciospongiae TaxID=909613 RepID=UPI001267A65E|nr:hypothetical protein [Actinokineospora spheciospongiae]
MLEAQVAVDRAGQEKDSQDRFATLTVLDADLESFHVRAQAAKTAAEAMRARGWQTVAVPSKIVTGLDSLARNPMHRSRNSTLRDLDAHLQSLEKDLQRFWTALVNDRLGQLNEVLNLVQVLAAVPSLADVAGKIDSAASELQRSRRALPDERSAAVLEQIPAMQEQLRTRVPQSVLNFLLATTRVSADLDMLTTEVIDWLKANGISAQFRVVAQKRGAQRG